MEEMGMGRMSMSDENEFRIGDEKKSKYTADVSDELMTH